MKSFTPVDRFELQPGYTISQIIKGGWHLAGGHGNIDENQAIQDMRSFVEAGITTFDCADIYTGVESLIGKFLMKYKDSFRSGNLDPVQLHTKYVPDYNALATLKREDTARIIERSLKRLGVEQLDLVQFAWWDYSVPEYVETAGHLSVLQKEGKIRYIGVTNFDGIHLTEILDSGIKVISNQLQYSVLDHRPEKDRAMVHGCSDIPYLCYGTLAGGFLSDRYLNISEPIEPLENRSLTKYRLIIDEYGGWKAFQDTLIILRKIADKYDVGIAEIVSRYILQKPKVAAIIIGARNINHLKRIKMMFSFKLEEDDLKTIKTCISHAKGPEGPVYDLERIKDGKHGRIMKYNLNET